jgi:23S rRNA (adenine2030-N6)-methyltransferase
VAGLYDLAAPEAAKTGEAADGIDRIEPDPATPYGRALARARAAHGPRAYPGSPWIARALLRPQDRLTLMELHPAEYAALRAAMGGARRSIGGTGSRGCWRWRRGRRARGWCWSIRPTR